MCMSGIIDHKLCFARASSSRCSPSLATTITRPVDTVEERHLDNGLSLQCRRVFSHHPVGLSSSSVRSISENMPGIFCRQRHIECSQLNWHVKWNLTAQVVSSWLLDKHVRADISNDWTPDLQYECIHFGTYNLWDNFQITEQGDVKVSVNYSVPHDEARNKQSEPR